ncbi:DUF1850 domain-containing protein [Robertmurraya andreesenii]|uniref:RocC n=1 Tax=Anoxybacillus andreesenii TaxID=1325932 RepID=A0ABT9UZ53_9BACL|nr:DUF1850 domain-containing protein [Robertmurraya andreesenii]MDQ0153971.1 hypothetical protein [Robertmurraya andreesenii]
MKKQQINWIIFLVTLVFLSLTILTFIPIKKALVFEDPKTENVLAYIPLSEEQTFKIKYTHSIHLSDVVESYMSTSDGQIKQYELMYEDFAIGMPSYASDSEIFEEKNGKYFLKNMNRVFPYFDLRIARVRANHIVIFQNEEFPLLNYFEKGTRVRIKIENLDLLQLLKGVNIIESK